jgi:hypothetical protein
VKVPSSDNVKAVGILLLAGVGIYAAYRVFKVGSDAAGAVSKTIGAGVDAVSGGVTAVTGAISAGYHKIIPNKPPPLSELPSSNGYPETAAVRFESTHARPQEINDYFNWNNGQSSPDAMGN